MEQTRFEDFVCLINALSKEIQRIKANEAAKLGLKGADIMCMYYLGRHSEGLTSAELARHAGVTRAVVSRALTGLESGGFVEVTEAEGDSRYNAILRLTPRGARAMEKADEVITRVVSQAGDDLADEQRAHMYESLNVILEHLRDISRS